MLGAWKAYVASTKQYNIMVHEDGIFEATSSRVFVRSVVNEQWIACPDPFVERVCMMWWNSYKDAVSLQTFLDELDAGF